jgi:hypothetical protein
VHPFFVLGPAECSDSSKSVDTSQRFSCKLVQVSLVRRYKSKPYADFFLHDRVWGGWLGGSRLGIGWYAVVIINSRAVCTPEGSNRLKNWAAWHKPEA